MHYPQNRMALFKSPRDDPYVNVRTSIIIKQIRLERDRAVAASFIKNLPTARAHGRRPGRPRWNQIFQPITFRFSPAGRTSELIRLTNVINDVAPESLRNGADVDVPFWLIVNVLMQKSPVNIVLDDRRFRRMRNKTRFLSCFFRLFAVVYQRFFLFYYYFSSSCFPPNRTVATQWMLWFEKLIHFSDIVFTLRKNVFLVALMLIWWLLW